MTSKKPLGLSSKLVISGVALVAAIAAAGVYVMQAGSGNGTAGSAGAVSASTECPIAPAKKAAIAAAAKGEVAAMTPLDPPRMLEGLSFKGPDARDRSLTDFSGKTVLLNLWATWCFPCREEMPALDRLQNQAGGNAFEVVAVNIDTGGDEKPKTFLADEKIESLGYYRDSSMGVFNRMKKEGLALGLPVTLLVDPKGCVVASMNGPAAWDHADARALIDAAGL